MSHIVIRNARSHNLNNVCCRIPLRALTVVTGVSGSGKSTLVFDTLYAEGQRRFVTSLSTYARQFLERLPRPDVDYISNLPPAIAIEHRNRVTNARSTVGTATEILDHLRLLFAKIGETRCPDCDRRVERGNPQNVAQAILDRWEGQRVALAAPMERREAESATALRDRLMADGLTRILDGEGQRVDLSEISAKQLDAVWRTSLAHSPKAADGCRRALVLIDRIVPSATQSRARLSEAVASAFERSGGQCVVVPESGERVAFLEGYACDGCGKSFKVPRPALFSFNSPLGACAGCQGLGRIPVLDRARVVPNPGSSLEQGAVAPFATPSGREMQVRLLAACRAEGVSVERPFESLTPAQRDWVFAGDGKSWRGVQHFFDQLHAKRYKVQARVLLARYRRFDRCPDCAGSRLCADARCVRVAGRDLGELCALTLAELGDWLAALELRADQRARAERLQEELVARVGTAVSVGLDYVTLDRPMRTLAGGEAQRIQLATALGGTLTASLYVLDEPSVGLHARDALRLVEVLRNIRDQGNTVVVVEHAVEIVKAADYVVDLGPGAGRYGGEIVAAGSVEEIARVPDSLTAQTLRGELAQTPRRKPRPACGSLRIVGARANNLRDVTVEIPLGQLVAVTGVSGAGKSSLIGSVLVGGLRGEPERGECDRIEGADAIEGVVVVDSKPPVRSTRSNPATISKAFDGIRQQFAGSREAKARGLTPGWFSFNVPGGRCESCEGSGEVVVDMQFLDDVRMPCEQCGGCRYRSEALQFKVAERSIADVLELSIDAALDAFGGDAKIASSLRSLTAVGLGYLTLGQPLSVLSGGELQRLRLSQALSQGGKGALFILDEPTTGLHPADVDVLVGCLDRVLEAGGSVIVVEHNLDVIRRADFVIDLGPEGGPAGGEVIAQGSPQEIARIRGSHTGAALFGQDAAH